MKWHNHSVEFVCNVCTVPYLTWCYDGEIILTYNHNSDSWIASTLGSNFKRSSHYPQDALNDLAHVINTNTEDVK
jgi:hypothetical protein